LLGVREATALAQGDGDVAIAIFFDAAHQLGAVELVRVHTFERLGAAPLPMLDQIAEQLTGLALRHLEEGDAWKHPGVVDQNIDRSEPFLHG
jgi:hypothetical protein